MIIDGLIMVLAALSREAMDLGPVVGFPNNGWASDFAVAVHAENAFNQVLPVEAILVCMAFGMVYLTGSTMYFGVMWLLRKIPFAGIS